MMTPDEMNKIERLTRWLNEGEYMDSHEIKEAVSWMTEKVVEAGHLLNEQTKVIIEQQKMLNDLSDRIRTVDLLRELVSKTGPKDAVD